MTGRGLRRVDHGAPSAGSAGSIGSLRAISVHWSTWNVGGELEDGLVADIAAMRTAVVQQVLNSFRSGWSNRATVATARSTLNNRQRSRFLQVPGAKKG